MTGIIDKTDPHLRIEQNLRERMASLEATNNFHRETLNDISSSLKEVVKTQHVLANQRDEILKLVKTVADIQHSMSAYNQDNFEVAFKINSLTAKVASLENGHVEVRKEVTENTHFVKLATKVITVILIPIVVSIINQYLKS